MNRIDYSPFSFDDTAIVAGNIAMQNALMYPDRQTIGRFPDCLRILPVQAFLTLP